MHNKKAVYLFLFLAICLIFVSCTRENLDVSALHLWDVRNENSTTLLDAQDAKKYLDEMALGIDDGRISGVLNHIYFPFEEEWNQYQYALYTGLQKHGNAFTVSVHVLTVYDGKQEKIGLAWIENVPGELKQYTIDGYLFNGDADVETELFFVCGYKITISGKETDRPALERCNYQQSSDGYYQKTEQIILTLDSVF